MKTPKDIKEAIDLGLHMNLDNELEVTKDKVSMITMASPDKYCECLFV